MSEVEGFRSSDGEILGGNLTRHTTTTSDTISPANSQSAGAPVLMKPEDFLKKRDGSEFDPSTLNEASKRLDRIDFNPDSNRDPGKLSIIKISNESLKMCVTNSNAWM